jgi:tRNA-splicing endonuclease subunit Sen2
MDRANAIAAAAAEAEEAFRVGKTVTSTISIPSGATWKPGTGVLEDKPQPQSYHHPQDEDPGGELNEIVDVEHLQLTPQEAFFLIWCFDCLSVLDPHTVCFSMPCWISFNLCVYQDEGMSLQEIWLAFQTCYMGQLGSNPEPTLSLQLRPDNPFIVNYVAYHHYRSLGWTVKSGLKFCVDYLLYKRGPAFDHAE